MTLRTKIGISIAVAGAVLPLKNGISAADPMAHLRKIEKEVSAFQSYPVWDPKFDSIEAKDDILILRRPWVSSPLFARIVERDRRRDQGQEDPRWAEMKYQIARHALLLNQDDLCNLYLQKLDETKLESAWKQRAQYLRASLSVKRGDRNEARRRFEALKKNSQNQEVAQYAALALARLAFDEKKYDEALRFYQEASSKSQVYASSLYEGAWAMIKKEEWDLASTNLTLLFSLFPRSPLLPEAGFMIGKLISGHAKEKEGISVLEDLATRFSLEESAIENFRLRVNHREEAVLLEFDPTLFYSDTSAHIPPLARTILENHRITKFYLHELGELNHALSEFKARLSLLNSLETYLQRKDAAVLQLVIFYEWLNDIEIALQKNKSTALNRSASTENILSSFQEDLRFLMKEESEIQENLLETEKHLWINWDLFLGARNENALDIKSQAREELRRHTERMENLRTLESEGRIIWLHKKWRDAQEEANRLKESRSKDIDPEIWKRIDKLRENSLARNQEYRKVYQGKVKELQRDLSRDLKLLTSLKAELLLGARRDMQTLLQRAQDVVSNSLEKYRWSIADIRHEHFQTLQKKIQDELQHQTKESMFLESLYPLEEKKRPLPVEDQAFSDSGLNDDHFKDFTSTAKYFIERANDRMHEIETFIHTHQGAIKARWTKFHQDRIAQLTNEREISREDALLAYRDFTSQHPNGDRVPYGLYRLGQLQFDRIEESKKRNGEKAFPDEKLRGIWSQDYSLASLPLNGILKNHRDFPHLDSTYYLLGYVYLKSEQEEKATNVFRALVEEFPDSPLIPEVQLRIGEYYFSKKNFLAAIPHYQEVLKPGFNFFYDKALYKLAWCNYLIGRYDSAISYFLILLDYSDELSEDQRDQFVEFESEAKDYVAFSMVKAKGHQTAQRIFTKIGWKPYALDILERMALISRDRANRLEALKTLQLAKQQYPKTSKAPDLARLEIELLEELQNTEQALQAKENVLRDFAPTGSWHQLHRSDAGAIERANILRREAAYSIATVLDHQFDSSNQGSKGSEGLSNVRLRAWGLYESIVSDHQDSKEAYQSSFRLGDLAYEAGRYHEAILRYDWVSRSQRFSDHFRDSLYGIVVAREKMVRREDWKKSPPPDLQIAQFSQAVDNFSRRAPKDPRVPQAIFRAGSLHAEAGHFEKAQLHFSKLVKEYPESEWSGQALIASTKTLMASEKWDEASESAKSSLERASELGLTTSQKAELLTMHEEASFQKAESFRRANNFDKARLAYLDFQKMFPSSELAPGSLFSAYSISRQESDFGESHRVLDLIVTNYPTSRYAAVAQLEKGSLYEEFFNLKDAARAYQNAFQATSDSSAKKGLAKKLIQILPAAFEKEAVQNLLELGRHSSKNFKDDFRFEAANLAFIQRDHSNAMLVYQDLARSSESHVIRAVSSARASQIARRNGRSKDADYFLTLAKKYEREIQDRLELSQASEAIAHAELEKLREDWKWIQSLRVSSRSTKELTTSFQRKATAIANFEGMGVQIVKRNIPETSVESLFRLSEAYYLFSDELNLLKPPPGSTTSEQKDFSDSLQKLRDPLLVKSREVLKAAIELLQKNRNYVENVNAIFTLAGRMDLKVQNEGWLNLPKTRILSFIPIFQIPSKKEEAKLTRHFSPNRGGKFLFMVGEAPLQTSLEFARKRIEDARALISTDTTREARSKCRSILGESLLVYPNSKEAVYLLALLDALEFRWQDFQSRKRLLSTLGAGLEEKILQATENHLKGDFKTAVEIWSDLYQEVADRDIGYNWVMALIFQGSLEEAETLAQELLMRNPKEGLFILAYAQASQLLGKAYRSLYALERLGEGHPWVGYQMMLEANIMDEQGRFSLASYFADEARKSKRAEPEGLWAYLSDRTFLAKTACKEVSEIEDWILKSHPDLLRQMDLCRKGGLIQ